MHFTVPSLFISGECTHHSNLHHPAPHPHPPSLGLAGRATVCILRDPLGQINGSQQPSTMSAPFYWLPPSAAEKQLNSLWGEPSDTARLLTMSTRHNRKEYQRVAEFVCVCVCVCAGQPICWASFMYAACVAVCTSVQAWLGQSIWGRQAYRKLPHLRACVCACVCVLRSWVEANAEVCWIPIREM